MSGVDAQHLRLLEAILFAAAEPVPERMLANHLPDDADVGALLEHLRARYAGRGVNLVKAGQAWALRTAPDLARVLTRETEVARRLSRAAVETLAIIGYHQPVTRAEIEEIRGVSLSRGTLDMLFEQGWVRPKGRRRTPGRPVTWGTTDAFLDHFGLESLGDLPGIDELNAAGLLDPRPAIDWVSPAGRPPLAGVELAEEPDAPADDPAEPLDPDDGVADVFDPEARE
jgi:segregation and condensation protein B